MFFMISNARISNKKFMLFRHNEEDIPHWPIDLQYHIYQLSRSSQWRYDLCAHSSYPPIMTMSYFGRDLLAVEFPHRTYLYHDHLPIVSEHWWARTAELQNCRPVGIEHMHPYLFPLNQSRMDLFRHNNQYIICQKHHQYLWSEPGSIITLGPKWERLISDKGLPSIFV